MKTAKRILAVILLAVILWAVGYLVFTGSRLPSVFTEEVTEETTITEITTVTDEGSETYEDGNDTDDPELDGDSIHIHVDDLAGGDHVPNVLPPHG